MAQGDGRRSRQAGAPPPGSSTSRDRSWTPEAANTRGGEPVVGLQHEEDGMIGEDGSDPDLPPLVSAVTDESGRFRLMLPRGVGPAPGDPPALCRADDLGLLRRPDDRTDRAGGRRRHRRHRDLRGHGRPVEGARSRPWGSKATPGSSASTGIATSDVRGRFQIGGLGPASTTSCSKARREEGGSRRGPSREYASGRAPMRRPT